MPPKPVDTKEWDAYNKYLTGGIPYDKVPGQTQNLPGFKTRTPIIQQYSPENQMVIGQHAANAYDTDKRWRSEANKYFNELQHNPEEYKRANELYKLRYGNDIDDPKEAWIAKGILDNNMKATEYKEGKDELGMAQFMENLRHMHAKELIKYKKDIDPNNTEMNNVWTKTYLDDVMQTAKNSGERHHVYNPSNGQSYYYYNMVKPDPFLLKSFAIGDRYPERLGVTEAGEMFPVFYKYDKDGKVITLKDGKTPALDNDLSQPMSYEQALVNVGFRGRTKKQIGEDFKGGIPGTTAPKVSSTDWKSRAKKVQ